MTLKTMEPSDVPGPRSQAAPEHVEPNSINNDDDGDEARRVTWDKNPQEQIVSGDSVARVAPVVEAFDSAR